MYVQQCTGFCYFAKSCCHTFFSTSHNKMLRQTQRLWALQDQVAAASVSGFSCFQISILHQHLFPPILSESKSAVCRNFVSGSPVPMLRFFTNVSSCCMLEISVTTLLEIPVSLHLAIVGSNNHLCRDFLSFVILALSRWHISAHFRLEHI